MDLRTNRQFKCLFFLAILSMTIFICHILLGNKFVLIPLGLLSLGSPFMPIYEIISDIVTEVYGIAVSMKFFWAENFANIIFTGFCSLFANLPSTFIKSQKSYVFVLGHASFLILYGTLIFLIAFRINAYLLVKWKILLKGKYFWLRSFISTMVGDTIFIFLMIPTWIWFNHVTDGKEALQLTISSLSIRIFFYIILAFPSTVIVNLLKIIEQIDFYDYELKFNPFKKRSN